MKFYCSIHFFSVLQIWYVKVRISRSISESPFDFEITRVDCIFAVFAKTNFLSPFGDIVLPGKQTGSYKSCLPWQKWRKKHGTVSLHLNPHYIYYFKEVLHHHNYIFSMDIIKKSIYSKWVQNKSVALHYFEVSAGVSY